MRKLKVILIGDSAVGKTTLITRWNEERFDSNTLPTINVGIVNVVINIDGVDCALQIWDTAGQENYRSLAGQFFHDSHAAMIVFDVTNRQSFLNIQSWIEILQSNSIDTPFLIVGNKCDLLANNPNPQFVTLDELGQKSDEFGCPFFFTSAVNDNGVNEAFQSLVSLALTPRGDFPKENKTVLLPDDISSNERPIRKNDCC